MRFRIALMMLVLVAAACSGDDASEDPSDAPDTAVAETTQAAPTTSPTAEPPAAVDIPPWGLDTIVLPDNPEAVQAVFDALPGEIDGLSGNDAPGRFEGALAMEYGGATFTIRATPIESVSMQIGTELTALEWLEMMASGLEGAVEGVALEADSPVAWIASAEEAGNETAYLAVWCHPKGLWYFDVVAASPEARVELIQRFVTAAAQT